jgi:hypothetical protein
MQQADTRGGDPHASSLTHQYYGGESTEEGSWKQVSQMGIAEVPEWFVADVILVAFPFITPTLKNLPYFNN